MVENVRTGTQQLAFTVLGAYGYPAKGRGRAWALRATPTAPTKSAPPCAPCGPPTPAPSLPIPFVARCEHHLHVSGVEAMEGDSIGGWGHWPRRRLDTALLRPEGWEELRE